MWNPAEVLPAEVIAALMGPGGTFEVVEEQVLGSPVSVFAQRPRSMREVLTIAAEQFPDRPSLVFPDETVSYGELMLRVGASTPPRSLSSTASSPATGWRSRARTPSTTC